MDFIQIFILALVQGITEFLPISSSAHLILVPVLTDWQDQGIHFDVAVHLGTLTAVVTYFRQDIMLMVKALSDSLLGAKISTETKLAVAIILGTIPVVLAGFVFKPWIEVYLRSPLIIATTSIVFGLLLLFADRNRQEKYDEYQITKKDALMIGLAQVLALIPGTSRSGVTMTAALFLGYTRIAAARFSFLLSIPVILAASTLLLKDLLASTTETNWTALTLGVVLSAISAWICIHYFLKFLNRLGMLPFVIYRVLLGAFLFLAFWPI